MAGTDIDLFHISSHIPRAYEVEGDIVRVRDRFFQWEFTCSSLGLEREDVVAGLREMQKGSTVQECFPTLNRDQREAFVSNPAIWEQLESAETGKSDK